MRNRIERQPHAWLGVVLLLLSAGAASAETLHRCAPDGVAVGGYDLISYRLADGPVPGDPAHSAQHGGLTYHFANRAHLVQFLAAPERFLPRYRGWCATNLAFGRLACPEYTNFKIENGALLLFEHHGFTNGRSLWNSDPLHHRDLADRQAERLLP